MLYSHLCMCVYMCMCICMHVHVGNRYIYNIGSRQSVKVYLLQYYFNLHHIVPVNIHTWKACMLQLFPTHPRMYVWWSVWLVPHALNMQQTLVLYITIYNESVLSGHMHMCMHVWLHGMTPSLLCLICMCPCVTICHILLLPGDPLVTCLVFPTASACTISVPPAIWW